MLQWLRAKISNWLFYREFNRAPIKKLGEIYVKEVRGNFYAVDVEVI